MTDSRQVIGIVGAAVAGPVFGLQILSHPILSKKFRPIIFEQLSQPVTVPTDLAKKPVVHTAGAAVGIFANGLLPLYELGLRPALDAISSELARVDVFRGNLNGSHKFYNTVRNGGWDVELRTSPRAVERGRLRDLLLTRFEALGGEIFWGKRVSDLASLDTGLTKVLFADGETKEVDLLVGADGAWSEVRKHILLQKDASTAEKRWIPSFTGAVGLYGISSGLDYPLDSKRERQLPLVLLDQGNIGALLLEDGKIAWTIHIPEREAPQRSSPIPIPESATSLYESRMVPGVYDAASTAEIVRKHENIHHPTFGTWKPIFEASERIIRSPLRQEVFHQDEIQRGNIVLIGDASRVVPPYIGQGSSFAIEDATVLADALLNNLPPQDERGNFRAALEEYAQRRVPRSKKLARMASWAGTLTMGNRWYWRWIRDLGSMLPVGGDPKTAKKPFKDPAMDWVFSERIRIKMRKGEMPE